MLSKTKKITIEGKSVVNEVAIATFRAVLDCENPADMSFFSTQLDKTACKENRAEVRADEAEFEDYAYTIQDEAIAEFGE